jgi:antitoxin component of MazEF toxin-antitoxin module
VKARAIGNSLGMVLPREIVIRPRIAEGDTPHVVHTADVSRPVRHNPEFARQMDIPAPRVGLMESARIFNAFTNGPSWDRRLSHCGARSP